MPKADAAAAVAAAEARFSANTIAHFALLPSSLPCPDCQGQKGRGVYQEVDLLLTD